jgi:hypothetical protein
MLKSLLANLEIHLSVAGLLVIFGVTALLTPTGVDPWAVAAVTAIFVGVLHGMIFWLVRRRQRAVRAAAFNDIQGMLKDIINNQLTIIETAASLHRDRAVEANRACALISESVETISTSLHALSEESLRAWQARYPGHRPGR